MVVMPGSSLSPPVTYCGSVLLPHHTPPPPPLFPYTTLFRSASPVPPSPTRPRPPAKPPALSKVSSANVDKAGDRKSTLLNSSHLGISYAVFCLKKKKGNRPAADAALESRGTHLCAAPDLDAA